MHQNKKVAVELLSKLKDIMARMVDWKANLAMKAQIKTEIYNFPMVRIPGCLNQPIQKREYRGKQRKFLCSY